MPNKIKYKYDRITLEKLVKESFSIREVMTKLGVSPISGGVHAHLKARIKKEGISMHHFKGKGANFGKNHVGGTQKLTLSQIFTVKPNGYKTKTRILRRALCEVGHPYICYICQLSPIWQGKSLTLQIEHKNGNPLDNREDNLEFICPNCHSQTDTFVMPKIHR